MNTAPEDPIGARARHDARMQMGNESVRGLFLVNGGGAIALLAFLQEIWIPEPGLAQWILYGLLAFTIGVTLAAPINLIRAQSSLFHQYGPAKKGEFRRKAYLVLTWLSVACFAFGCTLVIIGGFRNL